MGQGLLRFAQEDQGESQMIMRPRSVRVEPERLSELVCRFGWMVQFQDGKPKVVNALQDCLG